MDPGSKIYFRDNIARGNDRLLAESERAGKQATDPVPFVDTPPIWFDWIKVIPTDALVGNITADVGARPDDRDATDKRLIAEIAAHGGAIRDMPGDPRLQAARPLPKPPKATTQ